MRDRQTDRIVAYGIYCSTITVQCDTQSKTQSSQTKTHILFKCNQQQSK